MIANGMMAAAMMTDEVRPVAKFVPRPPERAEGWQATTRTSQRARTAARAMGAIRLGRSVIGNGG